MRCQCCNRTLSDYESTAKHQETNQYLDMCLNCLKDTGIPVNGRKDLDPATQPEDSEFEFNKDSDAW